VEHGLPASADAVDVSASFQELQDDVFVVDAAGGRVQRILDVAEAASKEAVCAVVFVDQIGRAFTCLLNQLTNFGNVVVPDSNPQWRDAVSHLEKQN
jgi:hypothetical protein